MCGMTQLRIRSGVLERRGGVRNSLDTPLDSRADSRERSRRLFHAI